MAEAAGFTTQFMHQYANQRFKRASMLALVFMLASCGGGGGGDTQSIAGGTPPASPASGGSSGATPATPSTPSTPPTTTASNVVFSGPISGFGSVIINGVRFDDSAATVVADDDGSIRTSDLRLGMMIELQGVKDSNGTTGKATSINTKSYVQGPITAIQKADGRMTVLGVPVSVSQNTFFDGVASLDGLNVNDSVEVHGIPAASGLVMATRVEKKTAPGEVRLIGIAQDANAQGFRLHGNLVRYSSTRLDNIEGRVVNGMQVRVRGTLAQSATITASRVSRIQLTPAAQSGTGVEIEGAVTRFTSGTDFEVNGMKVSVAGNARREGTPALGSRVEVEGAVNGQGVLVASKVEVKTERNDGSDDDATEVKSRVSGIDAQTNTFTLRDGTITVRWDANTRFDPLTLPQKERSLAVNQPLEIKGRVQGNVLLASTVKVDR